MITKQNQNLNLNLKPAFRHLLVVLLPMRITILRPRHLYRTLDGSKTWRAENSGFDTRVSRLTALFSSHPDASVLATEAKPFKNPRKIKLYLWGDHGFIVPASKPGASGVVK